MFCTAVFLRHGVGGKQYAAQCNTECQPLQGTERFPQHEYPTQVALSGSKTVKMPACAAGTVRRPPIRSHAVTCICRQGIKQQQEPYLPTDCGEIEVPRAIQAYGVERATLHPLINGVIRRGPKAPVNLLLITG